MFFFISLSIAILGIRSISFQFAFLIDILTLANIGIKFPYFIRFDETYIGLYFHLFCNQRLITSTDCHKILPILPFYIHPLL